MRQSCEALKTLKEENNSFHYLILGDGPLRGRMENRIREFHLAENVSILGTGYQTWRNFFNFRIFLSIHPKAKGVPNAILEAMAAGIPIIASNTGGTSEIVNAGNGFLFEYGNFLELKDLLKTLFQDSIMCEKTRKIFTGKGKKKVYR